MINTCKHNPCCGDMTYCVPPASPTSIKPVRTTMAANLDEAKEIAEYLRLDPNRVGWISYEEADHAARMIDALIAQLSGITDETSSGELLGVVRECHKQIVSIIEDGTPTDWPMWRDDLAIAISNAERRTSTEPGVMNTAKSETSSDLVPTWWLVTSNNKPNEWFTDEGSADQWANSPGVFDTKVTPLYDATTIERLTAEALKQAEWWKKCDWWEGGQHDYYRSRSTRLEAGLLKLRPGNGTDAERLAAIEVETGLSFTPKLKTILDPHPAEARALAAESLAARQAEALNGLLAVCPDTLGCGHWCTAEIEAKDERDYASALAAARALATESSNG